MGCDDPPSSGKVAGMRRILVAGMVSAALYAIALGIPDWGRDWSRFAGLYVLLIVAYLGAIWGVRGEIARGRAGSSGARDRRILVVLWTGAVLFRVLCVAARPGLSDDLYRYLWDGKVLLAGVNPYRYAPTAPALAGLRDSLWPLINHPDLPTIYPPLLMPLFAAAVALARGAVHLVPGVPVAACSVTAWKGMAAAADLAAGYAILRGLRALGRSPWGAFLYLWHPLAVIEFAGSGHADSFGILLVALAFWGWGARRSFPTGLALALAGLVKFLPWVALPALAGKLRWRWLLLPVVVLAAYAPFRHGGVNALGSLRVFVATWRANDFLYGFLPGAAAGTEAGTRAAHLVGAVLAGGIVLALWLRARPWTEVYAWGIAALFLLSPVVHPWYVLWLLPAAIFLSHPAWWVWSLTVFAAYAPLPAYRAGGAWTESPALIAAEYLPVLALAAAQSWVEGNRRRQERGSPREGSLPVASPGWWDRP
jgi:hypothetical protein